MKDKRKDKTKNQTKDKTKTKSKERQNQFLEALKEPGERVPGGTGAPGMPAKEPGLLGDA